MLVFCLGLHCTRGAQAQRRQCEACTSMSPSSSCVECLRRARGKAAVFSRGLLFLDNCDFSGSMGRALVLAEGEKIPVIRNAILGNNNCERKHLVEEYE